MIRNLIFTAFLCISTSANAEMPFSQYSQLKIDLTKYGKFVGAYEGCTARNSFQADWEQLGEKSEKEKEKKVIDERAYKVNFAKLKKKLKLPVKGKVIYKYNAKRSDTGTRWKGLFIKAKEGSNVKSVASGQVVFSDWLRGFGNIIIIDHGKSYMSLYGNNDSLLKQKGEFIKGGEVIALSGNSGGNKYNGLYYELRHNGKPFNPLKWTK